MILKLIHGDCLEILKKAPADSVDALVTDPPAGISFMGKEWDDDKGGRNQWIAWLTEVMKEAYRVMKPGAHGLVWALPRTSHWMATALENAGFEVRDRVQHIFGSGFPKSLDVSKAIAKAAGAEREVIGPNPNGVGRTGSNTGRIAGYAQGGAAGRSYAESSFLTAPATDAARQWSGWGTALKPACEDWWLIRKPLSEKTVAANVLKWGTGALNIDASRIGTTRDVPRSLSKNKTPNGVFNEYGGGAAKELDPNMGRFPSHLVLDEEAAAMLDAQSGHFLKAGNKRDKAKPSPGGYNGITGEKNPNYHPDGGEGASRFFYVAKASKSEKNAGIEDREEQIVDDGRNVPIDNPYLRGKTGRKNTHPTVKSVKLMQYLLKLITPPGGLVLDPFMGSGTTGKAAKSLGFGFIGIEREKEYLEIAKARITKEAA